MERCFVGIFFFWPPKNPPETQIFCPGLKMVGVFLEGLMVGPPLGDPLAQIFWGGLGPPSGTSPIFEFWVKDGLDPGSGSGGWFFPKKFYLRVGPLSWGLPRGKIYFPHFLVFFVFWGFPGKTSKTPGTWNRSGGSDSSPPRRPSKRPPAPLFFDAGCGDF